MSWTDTLERVRVILNTRIFGIGDTPVTVSTIIVLVLILVATRIGSGILQRAVRRTISRRVGHDGTVGAINKLLHYLILIIGWSIALQTVGIDLTALFAAGAVFAVGLGFAMKNIAENFVSGVILLVERSIRPGDVIEVEGRIVRVEHMGIRATLVQTRDGEDIILPNSILVQAAVNNYALQNPASRTRILVGVVYSSDMDEVEGTLRVAAAEASRSVGGVVADREPEVLMVEFGDNSVNFDVALWVSDPWHVRSIRSEVAKRIWWALKKQGIVIAFPQLDVHFDEPVVRGLEALAKRAS